MKLSEWRSSRQTEEELPSGLTVLLKKVSLVDLAAEGNIPAPLLGMIEEVSEVPEDAMIDLAEFPKYAEAINMVAMSVIQEPPIADEPDEEHLGIDELPFEDRIWLFEWASQEAGDLMTFREGQESDGQFAFDGAGLQPAAQ